MFEPYTLNGGSVVAIAGEDYAIIGADTRLSSGGSICTREQKKLFQLSDKTVLGATGCWCDTLTLIKLLEARIKMYQLEHGRPMTTPAIAQMLSILLYYKRFFPYLVNCTLAGFDTEGKGCVYSYDIIGHCDRLNFDAIGTGSTLLQPLLDNQIGHNNMQNVEEVALTRDKALGLLKDVFISAAERDIYTGDSCYILTITNEGVTEDKFDLRKD